MPEILTVWPSGLNTALVDLSEKGLVVDSRAIVLDRHPDQMDMEFHCTVVGETLSITRLDTIDCAGGGWKTKLYFRLYNSNVEDVPDFTSKTYMYHGLVNERAPREDIDEVIIAPSVKIIREGALKDCTMKRCTMGDSVERIEQVAFHGCQRMKHIRLSRNLRFLGERAFWGCYAIECLCIPPTVEEIQYRSFMWCIGMKVLILPSNIILERIGYQIIQNCRRLLNEVVQYERGYPPPNNTQVHQWLKHKYDRLPLHKLCTDPNVTAQMIREFMNDGEDIETEIVVTTTAAAAFADVDNDHGLTPLHILTRYNVFTDDDTIIACFSMNPSVLFLRDGDGFSPLENLWEDGSRIGVIIHMMRVLCVHWDNN